MRPVSIAWGGVLALVLTGAAVAAPLNPQPLPPGAHALNPPPLPPGSQAQDRRAQGAYVMTVCASRKAGGVKGRVAAASHGAGSGRSATGCASGKP